MRTQRRRFRFAVFGLWAVTIPATAFAYIDPNSAGILYQIFIPLVVAVTLAWRRIKETASGIWLRLRRRWD
jgi:hypothetical protein